LRFARKMVIHEFSGCSGHVARVLLCNEYVHLRVVSALQTWIDAVERLDEVVEEMIKLMQRRQLCRERRRVRWDLEAPQMLTTEEGGIEFGGNGRSLIIAGHNPIFNCLNSSSLDSGYPVLD
jgi:hypothetical protein